jgi:hypothetical protein
VPATGFGKSAQNPAQNIFGGSCQFFLDTKYRQV